MLVDHAVNSTSQAYRLAWAHWCEQRSLNPGRSGEPNKSAYRQGRYHRKTYAAALAQVLAEAFAHSELVRRELAGGLVPRPGGALEELLGVSRVCARDIALDEALYVPRTIETELQSHVADPARSGRAHLVVGDAGFGKSTLLWSLYAWLLRHEDLVPLVAPSTWIADRGVGTVAELLASGVRELEAHHLRLVVLLDTVDLLLHEETSRQELRRPRFDAVSL